MWARRPDLILLAGDYVIQEVVGGDPVDPADIFAVLNRLDAPLGVYAVMGNHDWWYGYDRIVAEFARHAPRLRLLEDASVEVSSRDARFRLTGVTDYTEGPMDFAGELALAGGEFNIVFTHSPDVFPKLPQGVDLTFAGHTHGGQVYIPLLGRPIVPSEFGEKYALGTVREGGKTLFVSVGVGTSILPLRFLTPPEVNIVTLQQAGAAR
jgi:predicted MPP superfamily phosphohydrolase